jgi:hypothetical protein
MVGLSRHILAIPILTLGLGFMAGFCASNKNFWVQQQHEQQGGIHQTKTDNNNISGTSTGIVDQQEQDHHCTTTLDALDETFNQRRAIRQARVLELAANPTLMPTLVTFFDNYEPEAVCFTEERFGGKQRYDAFGDGPKFACGIDYLREVTTRTRTTTTETTPVNPAGDSKVGQHDNEEEKQDNDNDDYDSSSSSCLVYSVGSNNQIEFEMSISQLLPGCEIHTFDPTLQQSYIGSNYSTFHPWGIGQDNVTITIQQKKQKSVFVSRFVSQSLMSIYHALGHDNDDHGHHEDDAAAGGGRRGRRRLNILKIDCEGCEYASMIPFFEAIIHEEIQVDQILIELHSIHRPTKSQWKDLNHLFAAADRAKMRITHKERNQWGCMGMKCVEYAWVSEDFLRRANGHVVCE